MLELESRYALSFLSLVTWFLSRKALGARARLFRTDFFSSQRIGKEKKLINIKNFGGTPPGVRPVCPGDTSHLSRDMSRLSRGHSVPLALIYT